MSFRISDILSIDDTVKLLLDIIKKNRSWYHRVALLGVRMRIIGAK